jgi:hypothetical protein
MKRLPFLVLFLFLLAGCRKNGAAKVEIYLLQSYTTETNPANPNIISINNAVLQDTPFVRDDEIRYYDQQTRTFRIRTNIKQDVQTFGPDKAFAVTVNNIPVYYGRVHPAYLSSMTIGIATIDPFLTGTNDLQMRYVFIDQMPFLQQLDKRNDPRILDAFRASGRLR